MIPSSSQTIRRKTLSLSLSLSLSPNDQKQDYLVSLSPSLIDTSAISILFSTELQNTSLTNS
jgi:hypothetical protein